MENEKTEFNVPERLQFNDWEKYVTSRFKSQWNGVDNSVKRFEPETSGISKTIPDQSMSVQEIMRRFAQGLPLGGEKVPIYDGDEEYLPDPKTLDISEIEDMKIANRNEIANKKQRLADLDAERKKVKSELGEQQKKAFEKSDKKPEQSEEKH